MVQVNGFYMCQRCGVDVRGGGKFDEYWSKRDERLVSDELDDWFYAKYPEYDK